MSLESKDPLDLLLDRAKEVPPPADITREVWQRISLAEASKDEQPSLLQLLNAWFAHWPTAALFIFCCALTGLFIAEVRASELERNRNSQLARSYLELIDPLLIEMSTEQES